MVTLFFVGFMFLGNFSEYSPVTENNMVSSIYRDHVNIINLNQISDINDSISISNKKKKRATYESRLVSRSRSNFSSKFLNKAFKVMNGIKLQESGGSYTSESSWSSASGAYGYIDSTWNNYGGYSRAKYAPKLVQDQRMLESLHHRWKEKDGDWEKVIAAHFYPAWSDNKSLWGKSPGNGNPTIREYVNKVKDKAKI
jgi:hypothetical protein